MTGERGESYHPNPLRKEEMESFARELREKEQALVAKKEKGKRKPL